MAVSFLPRTSAALKVGNRLNTRHPSAQNLVAFYSCNEANGGTLGDLVRSGPVTLFGSPAWDTGIYGPEVVFDGASQYGQAADSPGFEAPTNAVTLVTSYRITSNPTDNACYAGKRFGFNFFSYGIVNRVFNTFTDTQAWLHVGGSSVTTTAGFNSLSLNTQYTIALRWQSGEALNIRVYSQFGQLLYDQSTGATATGTIDYDTQPFLMGRMVNSDSTGASYLPGKCSFTLVSSRKWSDAELAQFAEKPLAILSTPRRTLAPFTGAAGPAAPNIDKWGFPTAEPVRRAKALRPHLVNEETTFPAVYQYPRSAPPPVAFKTEFAANFARWGNIYGIGFQGNNPYEEDPMNYYDSIAVGWKMYYYYLSIGDTANANLAKTYSANGFIAWKNYSDTASPPGHIPAWRTFPEGLWLGWVNTGDTEYKRVMLDIINQGAYVNYNDPYLTDFFGSRENAYRLMCYVYGYLAGVISLNTTAINVLVNNIYLHFLQWQRLSPPTQALSTNVYIRPFMVSLSTRALIRVIQHIGPLPGALDKILQMWNYIYNIGMWGATDANGSVSLKYTDVDTSTFPTTSNGYGTGGTEAAPDLNWLINPVFAWLWTQTGSYTWRQRFDDHWAQGLARYYPPPDYSLQSGAYLGNQKPDPTTYPGDTQTSAGIRGVKGKQVNQNYLWSTEGITWAESIPLTGSTTPIYVDSYYEPMSEPPRRKNSRAALIQQNQFVPIVAPPPVTPIDRWFTPSPNQGVVRKNSRSAFYEVTKFPSTYPFPVVTPPTPSQTTPTSFLISVADIPLAAHVITTDQTFAEDGSYINLFSGERYAAAWLASNQPSLTLTFDLGAGNAKNVDHLIFAKGSALAFGGVTVAYAQGSNDGVTYTRVLGTASGLLTKTYLGPLSEDLLFTPVLNDDIGGPTGTAYRYWQVVLTNGLHRKSFSKLYFGAWFDMGKDVAHYDWEIVGNATDPILYPRGNEYLSKTVSPHYKFTIEWDGVTDAKVKEFTQRVLRNPAEGLFLHTQTITTVLAGQRLAHCKVIPEETEVTRPPDGPQSDYWLVKAVFEEIQ